MLKKEVPDRRDVYNQNMKNIKPKIKIIIIVFAVLVFSIGFFLYNNKPEIAEAIWWNDSWQYRQSIQVTNNTSTENNVYISVTLDTATASTSMQADCGDFRFTRENGEVLPYYIVSGCRTATNVIHINFPIFDAGQQAIYFYYGNASAENGFAASDFATEASNYTIGAIGTAETGPGPGGYWSFDEGYGTVAHDESANKIDGIITDATWKNEEECVSGKCLHFDGSDYVSVQDDMLTTLDKGTIIAWVKINTLGSYKKIFRHTYSGAPPEFAGYLDFEIYQDTNYYLSVGYNQAGMSGFGSHIRGTTQLEENKFYHVALVSNGSSWIIYLNGNEENLVVNNGTNSGNWISDVNHTNHQTLIGNLLDGNIDEVKIYPYARTADQIKQDYAAGFAGVKSNSGVAVSFGSQSDKWMSDGLVGNGKNGTYYGDASTTAGKFGNGFIGDGAGDYIDLPNGDTYLNETVGTIAMWYKANGADSSDRFYEYNNGGCDVVSINFVTNTTLRFSYNIDCSGSVAGDLTVSNITTDTNWHFITYSWDVLKQKMILSYDGTVYEYNKTFGSGTFSSANSIISGTVSGGQGFKGQLDEVRIYNRALSPSEVKKLYEWAPGPVLHLKMDEMNGTSTYDVSGYGNDGVFVSAASSPSWIGGRYGNGLDFDGVNDYVQVASDDHKSEIFTVEAWIYHDTYTQSGDAVFGCSSWSTNFTKGFVLRFWGSNTTLAAIIGETSAQTSISTTVSLNTWTHVVMSYDGTTLKLYKNGILANSLTGNYSIPTNDLRIGRDYTNAADIYFHGKIDDVRIYNYARTQKQILEDMNGGGPARKSPVLHLSFDEGYGTVVHDSSIYGNNGTPYPGTAGTQTATSSMWEKGGKLNGAMEFDGTDDYVDLGDIYFSGNQISISMWFKATSIDALDKLLAKRNALLYEYLLGFSPNGTLRFWVGFNGIEIETKKIISTGEWYHVLGTADGLNAALYINGELAGTASNAYTITDSGYNTTIGARDDNTLNFNGKIDEVKIWNYALNEYEIKSEYNFGVAAGFGNDASRDSNGTTTTGASKEYCVPGDTATCTPPTIELKMDEMVKGDAKTIYDISGNGNNGTTGDGANNTGMDCTKPGKNGTACEFEGVDDYVGVDSPIISTTESYTISTWFKTNSSNPGYLYSETNSGSGDFRVGIVISDLAPGTISFLSMESGGSDNLFYFGNYNDNKWHYVVARKYYDGYMDILVDGIVVTTGGGNATSSNIAVDQAFVGADYFNSSMQKHFDGQIDDLKIYNYARTPAQIAWDYNRGKPVAHYKFDECSGSTIHNYADNSLHGTLNLGTSLVTATGTCASSSNSFWSWGDGGKHKHAAMFDGRDDYIDIGDTNTNINTVSFWWTGNIAYSYPVAILQQESHVISISNGKVSAGNFSSPTYYIDGTEGLTLPDNNWHHVVITTNTAIDVSGLGIGGDGLVFMNGFIDDFKMYNYALTAEQVKMDYNGGGISMGTNNGWTCGSDKLTDIDGNSYETVLIGDQCWMAQNLTVSRNADGSAVNGTGDADTTPPAAYGDADGGHDDANANWEPKEGYLYNWQDAMNGATASGSQGICPDGWHIPNHFEWTDLERFVCEIEGNGSCDTTFPKNFSTTGYRGTNEGTELKAINNVNGIGTDPNGDDGYGYAGLLSGYHLINGSFYNRGAYGYFWSSSENGSNAWYRNLNSSDAGVNRNNAVKGYGLSVRCLKD